MSRKKVVRNLPSLESLIGPPTRFPDDENHRHGLEQKLREVVRSISNKERVPFYPMREVAAHFSVPLKTVAVVYERLSHEGFLTVVRGSSTILESRKQKAKSFLRGVVGIPVSLPSFVYGPQPRTMFIHLENLLRRKGYVVDFLFYPQSKSGIEDLTDRLLSHALDLALWMSPVSAAKETILRLHDAGVSQLVVADAPGVLPYQRYTMNISRGFTEAAALWKSAGIREIHLVMPQARQAAQFYFKCRQQFANAGFTLQEIALGPDAILDRISALRRDGRHGIVFLEHFHYEMLCNHDWRKFLETLRRHRCLFAQGLVYHAAFRKGDAVADVINFDFEGIAKRLAEDIVSGGYKSADCDAFSAACRPAVDVASDPREF
jgi:hypothetical protein